jgi:flagellar motor switch protein FliM
MTQEQELNEMKIGDWMPINSGPMEYSVLRVPNGWMYTTAYGSSQFATSVFVPHIVRVIAEKITENKEK